MYSKMQGRAGRFGNGRWLSRPSARDDDHFAVVDFAEEGRADDVEGAGLRGEHKACVPILPITSGLNADRITHADQHVVGGADERIRAFDLAQRLDQAARRHGACATVPSDGG